MHTQYFYKRIFFRAKLSNSQYFFFSELGFFDESKPYSSQDDIGRDRSFKMINPLAIQDDDNKPTDGNISYEELRRRNRNQWMTSSQRQPNQNSKLQV